VTGDAVARRCLGRWWIDKRKGAIGRSANPLHCRLFCCFAIQMPKAASGPAAKTFCRPRIHLG
jgi:hypothetical protein